MVSDVINDKITLFYKISELNRTTILKACREVGRSEDEFIKNYSKTTKYAYQSFYYYLFKLLELKEFQHAMVVFVIGLILILIFVK